MASPKEEHDELEDWLMHPVTRRYEARLKEMQRDLLFECMSSSRGERDSKIDNAAGVGLAISAMESL